MIADLGVNQATESRRSLVYYSKMAGLHFQLKENVMKKLAVTALLLTSFSANAAIFDFAGYANGTVADGNGTFFSEGNFGSATEDGINVVATASRETLFGTKKAYSYLDASNRNGDAGLGVCYSSDCNGWFDTDQVSDAESLVLSFSKTVTLGETLFRNKDHKTSFGGAVTLSVDGLAVGDFTLANMIDFSSYNYTGTEFTFANKVTSFGDVFDKKDNFYLSSANVSAVPIPAAAFLFAPALLGFMGLRRKAKNSVA